MYMYKTTKVSHDCSVISYNLLIVNFPSMPCHDAGDFMIH